MTFKNKKTTQSCSGMDFKNKSVILFLMNI